PHTYPLSLHDALPISQAAAFLYRVQPVRVAQIALMTRARAMRKHYTGYKGRTHTLPGVAAYTLVSLGGQALSAIAYRLSHISRALPRHIQLFLQACTGLINFSTGIFCR